MKYLLIILSMSLLIGLYLILNINYEKLNPVQKFIAQKVFEKWDVKINSLPASRRAVADYDSLLWELSLFERIFVKRVFSIRPAELGFKGPYYSMEKPSGLVRIQSIKLKTAGKETWTGIQYYPEKAYKDFMAMSQALYNETGCHIYIGSGYRSPGRQAYLFFKYLVSGSNYSLRENAKWIAMPGFSEHGNPVNTSADFVNEFGINGISENQSAADFENLPEYKWLVLNARKYNFHLSYPKNNSFGVAFEPWHWHWKK